MSDSPFAALGEPTRRRILELLADGEQSVGTLHAALAAEHPLSQPAVSQHLRVLREAGLVAVRADGARRLYALEPSGVARAAAWLEGLLEAPTSFTQPFDALDTEIARGRRTAATPTGRDRGDEPTPQHLRDAASDR